MSSQAGTANSTAEIFQAIVPRKSFELTLTGSDQILTFSKGVTVIRLANVDNPVFISSGKTPTTSDASNRAVIPPAYIEYFSIPAGESMAISGNGMCFINEAGI